ncbi:Cation/H(+) antiporter 4 Protein CATION/H+ EXCHANGER 4 [Vigna angularis]|uniref:Cation/H(+) antiporter 4 Protein CATION/H+ EXCHANGER 4 n=1 Tax=Phaseolus angularis TaxID=3914 RepID=A0A8T0JW94_PHAAN|nr:cation/H(+) antiporter 4 [Vigna angularis]KAG2384705.1 Cation/H(+) antiporter 4 Protein CATION/H+ EXCHANGER 4 [Vigna angularis]
MGDKEFYVTSCTYLPPRVNSDTPWCTTNGMLPTNAFPMLEMQICIIFLATFLLHNILGRLRFPRFTSMSIVGLILATSFTEEWARKSRELFFFDSQASLGMLSVFGYMLFLFYTGVKTDVSVIPRTKSSSATIGCVTILAPFICSMTVVNLYSTKYLNSDQVAKVRLITGVFSVTPFPNICTVLSDLKILNSELGRLSQSAALVTELFNVVFTSILSISKILSSDPEKAWFCLIVFILFLLIVMFVYRPAMFWIIKQTPEGSPVSDHYVYFILIMAFMASYITHRIGFLALFGPFALGMATPEGPPLGTAVIKKIDTFVNWMFMPLFVTTCVMRVDLRDFMKWRDEVSGEIDQFMLQALIIIAVTSTVKFVVCVLLPLYHSVPFSDSVSLSLVLNCKGVVELAGFSIIRDLMGMPDNVLALVIVSIILSATVGPFLLAYLYDPMKKYAGNYTKRNIFDLKNNSELRVLTCIHRPDNIPPTINLLEATFPTKDNPLCVYALQLIELIGRAAPVFISHQLQSKKKHDSNASMADKLIDAFQNFEHEFKDALVVNTFTSISPTELMYDDICTLALNKFTSLIVLPFHKKWSSDGNSIEIEDESLRELNFRVMRRAPCSVGILIERMQMTHIFSPETPYTVCMLFIGGKDDREALYFAKRMTKNPHVRLTVVRFLARNNYSEVTDLQELLDTEILNDIRINGKVGETNMNYIEKIVQDGPETALVIRKLVKEYDLIIVGRQAGIETPQTSGLLQWSEYPELGVLGDLLASTDAAGKATVFVMQQQRRESDA